MTGPAKELSDQRAWRRWLPTPRGVAEELTASAIIWSLVFAAGGVVATALWVGASLLRPTPAYLIVVGLLAGFALGLAFWTIRPAPG